MREIKFRAWSPIGKKFVYGFLGQWFFDAALNPNGLDGTEDGTDLSLLNLQPWQQFTGLETKKGNEVYEGDILENDSEWWEVVFSEGQFTCHPIRGGNVWMDLAEIASSSETNHCGNIYEHPHLLTNEKE